MDHLAVVALESFVALGLAAEVLGLDAEDSDVVEAENFAWVAWLNLALVDLAVDVFTVVVCTEEDFTVQVDLAALVAIRNLTAEKFLTLQRIQEPVAVQVKLRSTFIRTTQLAVHVTS